MSTRTDHAEATDVAPENSGNEPKVCHLYSVHELRTALFLDVDVRTFCGIWRRPFDPTRFVSTIKDPDGRLWAVPERQDCRACVDAFEARNRGARR